MRWCPRVVRPPWVVEDRDEWLVLDAAVAPASGAGFVLLLPGVSKEWLALLLAELGHAVAGHRVGLVLDRADSQRAAVI